MNKKFVNSQELYQLFQLSVNLNQEEQFRYLNMAYIGDDSLLVALDSQNTILGIIQFGESPKNKIYWMKFVCVHQDHRQSGIAKALIRSMCDFLSKIENAQIELSTYEKEGEVLINSVSEIAREYPDLVVKHRVWGGIYQDAKANFIKAGDVVQFLNHLTGEYSEGTVMYFEEFLETPRVMIKTKSGQASIELSNVKKQ